MRKLLSSLLVLILRPSETGPRSGLQYVARTLGTLWTCPQRVDARAEGGSERPPLHQYRVTIQTPNHKLAGGAKFGTVPKQNPTSFCMSANHPNSGLAGACARLGACLTSRLRTWASPTAHRPRVLAARRLRHPHRPPLPAREAAEAAAGAPLAGCSQS